MAMSSTPSTHEELAAVGVAVALVGTRQQAAAAEAQALVRLVDERLAVDALAARAAARGVAALDDEAGHEAVEADAVVVALEAELDEVAARQRTLLGPEPKRRGEQRTGRRRTNTRTQARGRRPSWP
jgi:hypothetical protein